MYILRFCGAYAELCGRWRFVGGVSTERIQMATKGTPDVQAVPDVKAVALYATAVLRLFLARRRSENSL